MTVSFAVTTAIAAPIDVVFDLARDIDAHVASQDGARERAIAGVTGGLIGPGETVTFQAKHFRVRFTLTSRISAFDRPHRFVDEQVRGPFKAIRHEHLFSESDDVVTMVDRVRFTAPFGPIGHLTERVVLGRYLHNLILERGEFLKTAAEQHEDT